MKRHTNRPAAKAPSALIALGLAAGLLGLPAWAASSASSASSDAASTSVGSVSTSFEKSSDSSSKGTKVADGEYRIIELAAAEQRPGTVRLKLQAVAAQGDDDAFVLYLPQPALDAGRLSLGEVVSARQRDYGLEFAKADKAFFLVLQDAWYRELQTQPVRL